MPCSNSTASGCVSELAGGFAALWARTCTAMDKSTVAANRFRRFMFTPATVMSVIEYVGEFLGSSSWVGEFVSLLLYRIGFGGRSSITKQACFASLTLQRIARRHGISDS